MIPIKKLYIASLPWSIDDQQLADLFAPFGEVSSASVIKDRETGRSRGFGFVEMTNDEEADAAIEKLNGSDVEGRKIIVNVARPKAE